MPGIGVIVNLRAQRNLREPCLLERMQQILGDTGVAFATRRADELEVSVGALRDRGAEVICIAGGDGTVHLAVQEIFRTYREHQLPLILPLPAGTMNNVARATELRGSPLQILKQLATSYRTEGLQPGRELLTLRINDKNGFIFGLGFPLRLLEEYYRGRGRGPLKAARVFLKACWAVLRQDQFFRETFAWLDWEVAIDEIPLPFPRYNALLCATVKDLGCGLKPTYRCFERPRHFHAVISSLEPLLISSVLPKIVLGTGTGNKRIYDRVARRVVIRAQAELPYFIDGELYRAHRQLVVEGGRTIQLPSF